MNKICFLFVNNEPDKYDYIYNLISKSVDYIDFYNIKPDWEKIHKTFGDMMFVDEVNGCKSPNFSGNLIFVLLYFKLQHNQYDYFFVSESDVLFTGNYQLLFDELTRNLYDYDAIIQNDFWYPPKDWCWTENERYYNLLDGYSKDKCYNLLYKFYCLSNDLVDTIFQGYIDGYYGHQDLVISCIMKAYNGRYDYLSNHFNTNITVSMDRISINDLKTPNSILHPIKRILKPMEIP